MAFKIEKGIPMPESQKTKLELEAVAKSMSVGDSFKIEGKSNSTIYQLINRLKLSSGLNFCVRKIDEGVYRVWRIK